MRKFDTYFHTIIITLFPVNDYAFIHFEKSGYNYQTKENFHIKTIRKVSFDYAIKYLVRHNMKMVQTEYKYMFRAQKG